MFIERPEISVILLTHNRPEGLKEALKSIYAQIFKKFEVIVLDNGNTSNYPDIIEDYLSKDNLRYLKFNENEEYLGKRLNQGLSITNGEYITFLMDDDTWEKDALKNLHSEISKGFDFIYGKVKSIDKTTGKQVYNSYAAANWQKGIIKRFNPIHITSVIIRRDVFDKIGGFHEEMKRSYDLNLWNRIFQEANCKRIDKIISQISVNDLSSVTGRNPSDLNQSSNSYIYPLVGYWSNRKNVSFLGDERVFIDQINSRNQSWIATPDSFETDASVCWAPIGGIDTYSGNRYYYIDHPLLIQDNMVAWSEGIISQFPFETSKPHHLLRPTISLDILTRLDKIYYSQQENLKILCLKITESNLDFIQILMDYVADRYNAIYFYLFPNVEAEALLRDIPNVIPTVLQEDSYDHFKKQGVDVVLHVDGDFYSYVDAYKSFLASTALKAPLVSSPNIAYNGLLNHEEDLYISDTIHQFVWNISKTKDTFLRENMIRSMRKKTYLYFLDQVVLDQFILFLNENHRFISNVVAGTAILEQLDANSSVILHSGEYISQSFIPKFPTFNCIQFFGNVLNNQDGALRFTLKCNDILLEDKLIPNYKLKNGANTIQFNEKVDVQNKEFIFTLYGDIPIFKLDYNNVVMSAGIYSYNGVPKKACLKFRILQV